MNRILVVFICTIATMVLVSFLDNSTYRSQTMIVNKSFFVTSTGFKLLSLFIFGVVVAYMSFCSNIT